MELQAIPGVLWVSRLDPGSVVAEPREGSFFSVTRSSDEVSVVGPEPIVGARVEGPWSAFRVAGVLDFSLTGVLHELTRPLALAGVSVFVQSTFDTDYILVRSEDGAAAIDSWKGAGHRVES